jgi:tRNA threonylcarbamoyladenosine biosynthesis protein TsaE
MPFVFTANNESDTDRFGAALARFLPAGAVIALWGTLGAGKTRLVQAVAKAAGIDPLQVVSPTFVLVHEYHISPGRKAGVSPPRNPSLPARAEMALAPPTISTIYHFDAYRIRDDDEFLQLGPEEYFESDGWAFVEWADRVANCLPPDHLRIEIEVSGPTQRRFTVTAVGTRFGTMIDELSQALSFQPGVPPTAKHAEP